MISYRDCIISALVLAFAGMGDAFLYTALPADSMQMDVPVLWIGFLLSINRFVRLVGNQVFAVLFSLFGFKAITVIAATLAVLSTLLYGLAQGIIWWITARVIWGLCYSALRISSISYSLTNRNFGYSIGLNRGLQELGPIVALLVGPFFLENHGKETTFIAIALASLPAVILAFFLPMRKQYSQSMQFRVNLMPSSFDFLAFVASFFVQGILAVVLAKLFIEDASTVKMLMWSAGLYLVFRKLCTIVISPLAGLSADRFGLEKVYLLSLVLTGAATLLIALGFTQTGIVAAFAFNSVTAALGPGGAAGTPDELKVISANSTWNDIGAALGALLGGTLLLSGELNYIFIIATFVLLAACLHHIKKTNYKYSELIRWR
ncbi:MFS transporter [uncultured Flavobacterium sp.]|uniref:MFS transporter n=1 Tax=uncultured Flavobacterium sp. TaxID=165435 RepID=UPI003452CC07